jgi:hypothetical protein
MEASYGKGGGRVISKQLIIMLASIASALSLANLGGGGGP